MKHRFTTRQAAMLKSLSEYHQTESEAREIRNAAIDAANAAYAKVTEAAALKKVEA